MTMTDKELLEMLLDSTVTEDGHKALQRAITALEAVDTLDTLLGHHSTVEEPLEVRGPEGWLDVRDVISGAVKA